MWGREGVGSKKVRAGELVWFHAKFFVASEPKAPLRTSISYIADSRRLKTAERCANACGLLLVNVCMIFSVQCISSSIKLIEISRNDAILMKELRED
jgi:hypothetical protein